MGGQRTGSNPSISTIFYDFPELDPHSSNFITILIHQICLFGVDLQFRFVEGIFLPEYSTFNIMYDLRKKLEFVPCSLYIHRQSKEREKKVFLCLPDYYTF